MKRALASKNPSFCLAMAAAIALGGCANAFSYYYQPAPNLQAMSGQLAPYSGKTQVIESDHARAEVEQFLKAGYAIIGSTRFVGNGPPETWTVDWRGELQKQGQKVGADIVVMGSKYDHTESETGPERIPVPGHGPVPTVTEDVEFDRDHVIFLRKIRAP